MCRPLTYVASSLLLQRCADIHITSTSWSVLLFFSTVQTPGYPLRRDQCLRRSRPCVDTCTPNSLWPDLKKFSTVWTTLYRLSCGQCRPSSSFFVNAMLCSELLCLNKADTSADRTSMLYRDLRNYSALASAVLLQHFKHLFVGWLWPVVSILNTVQTLT